MFKRKFYGVFLILSIFFSSVCCKGVDFNNNNDNERRTIHYVKEMNRSNSSAAYVAFGASFLSAINSLIWYGLYSTSEGGAASCIVNGTACVVFGVLGMRFQQSSNQNNPSHNNNSEKDIIFL